MRNRRFGDIGTEICDRGKRKVMWIAPGQVVILFTDVPEDPTKGPQIVPGVITYAINGTEWSEMPEDH